MIQSLEEKWQSYNFQDCGGGGEERSNKRGTMSTLMQILNLYATTDSQIKFEANRMKNGKVTVLRLMEEEEKEEEEKEEEEEEDEKIYKH